MGFCGCADQTPASQPRAISNLYGEATIRRRLHCDDCDQAWTQIEVRDGEVDDADG